jgi:RNA polymerase sigma factor (sigma-70 family)
VKDELQEQSFERLLARVRAGDEEAATVLVRKYESALERVVRLRLVDRRLQKVVGVSDICQSVMKSFFVRMALGQYDLKKPQDLLKLFAVMARNKIADQARRKDVERQGPPAVPLDEEQPTEIPSAQPSPSRLLEIHQLARDARAKLSPELRELVELRAEGLQWGEIAARVGGNPEALRKRVTRATDLIAAALDPDRVRTPRS